MSKLSELLKKHGVTAPTLTGLKLEEPKEPTSMCELNSKQQEFVSLATSGASCVLLGAAGTGKTFSMNATVTSLLTSSRIFPLAETDGHKYLIQNSPGIVLCSFTRRAVRNLRNAVTKELNGNCITIHKLLEYAPVQYEVYDEETSSYKMTMRFEAQRNALRKLPAGIKTIIIDESSMVSLELFQEIILALPYPSQTQFIFLGDIQQLPPVFGSAVLGYKMLELPVIELTQVYRQALESPIIRLAHRILSGKGIPATELTSLNEPGLTLHPWKKRLHSDIALITIANFFTKALDSGAYNPEEDMILCPFNKAFGTIELNKFIANHIAKTQSKVVYEVVAGYNRHYFSVGDKVLFEKEDAEIIAINRNAGHTGKFAQQESVTLDYWGMNSDASQISSSSQFTFEDVDNIDLMLDKIAGNVTGADDERVTSSSHVITVRMIDSGEEFSMDSASEINNLLLAYSLTVHKAQGSEWRRVFVALHQSHNTMVQRELLYTAITRAREELYVICAPDHFMQGIESQRIKGNTLAEKSEYFKGKIAAGAGA